MREAPRRVRLAAGSALVGAVALVAALAPVVAPHPPEAQDLSAARTPPAWLAGGGWSHPLGTDHLGRDVLSRLVYGARVSALVGAGGVGLALALGAAGGLAAGYRRGWLDAALMRLADVQLGLPYLLFVVAVVGVLGPSLRNVVLVLGIADVPLFARLTRAETLRLRSAPFVEAAAAAGASHARILLRHLLPNMAGVLSVVAAFEVAAMILSEAGVGFLGLSVPPTVPSWGNMLADGRDYLTTAWWVATFPGCAIAVAALGITLVGDGLRARHAR
jgi:ABC-type dipeptide/oligopeptide/nickel transport system permease subunit